MSQDAPPPAHDAYAALRIRDFRYFLAGHLISTMGTQMQTVAVGWHLYERTRSAFALGLVGLVQVLPVMGLALPAGHVADRYNRRKLLMASTALVAVSAFGLGAVSALGGGATPIYACLLLGGVARAFQGPVKAAFLPQIVPRRIFSNAVSWNATGFELASMIGPAVGGLLIALLGGATAVFVICGIAAAIFFGLLIPVSGQQAASAETSMSLRSIGAGVSFVRGQQILLGAMTLDMFAVLLGGAVALLPVYAKDILHVGPTGLGWLQAAPSFGAVLMALAIAHLPPLRRAGTSLLTAVAGFGIATIVFGLSRSFWLSMIMLFLTGAFDNISVVIRHTIVQILTPDSMRGRVSAINGVFISASNELGRFESGSVAALCGPVCSVVFGGIGTVVVVALTAAFSPQLRRYGALDGGESLQVKQ